MKFALINPNWSFDGSIYFGCREPHLPLEYGYAKALIERAGHEAEIIDGQLFGLSLDQIRAKVADYRPDFTVVTTAPSYLFWRCAPPELRVPQQVIEAVRGIGGALVAVGPHGSTTPRAAYAKLGVDVAGDGGVRGPAAPPGLRALGRHPVALHRRRTTIPASTAAPTRRASPTCRPCHGRRSGSAAHHHHHHRFDTQPSGPGAEMETSRGCPYRCSFCAKENFRDKYRKRPLPVILEELDRLIAQGVEYVYFIDEIFLPNAELLEALAERPVKFGVQTRIDLWKEPMLELLGRAGCVSIEAGVESLTPEGRQALDKNCRMSTDELTDRLIFAKRHVPFVQANLIEAGTDDDAMVDAWRLRLREHGVWANEPVPLFPYPGSPDYRKLWGIPDDQAWERALDHYLTHHVDFSDIQDQRPRPLHELELATVGQR